MTRSGRGEEADYTFDLTLPGVPYDLEGREGRWAKNEEGEWWRIDRPSPFMVNQPFMLAAQVRDGIAIQGNILTDAQNQTWKFNGTYWEQFQQREFDGQDQLTQLQLPWPEG